MWYIRNIISTTMHKATKPGMMITYSEKFPSIQLQEPLIMWSCKMTWQNKYVISLLPQGRLLPQNLVGCSNKITNFLPSYFRSLDNVVWQGHVTNSVHYISTTTLIMTIKLGRAMRLYGASTHKSRNALKTWLYEITWLNKWYILLPQSLWPLNMEKWWLPVTDFHPWSHTTL